jgi:hypothetical protein
MTTAVRQLLDAFDALPEDDKHRAAVGRVGARGAASGRVGVASGWITRRAVRPTGEPSHPLCPGGPGTWSWGSVASGVR